jgi:hypothetical protein
MNFGTRHLELEWHATQRFHPIPRSRHRIRKTAQPHSVLHKPFKVDVSRDNLLPVGKTVRFREEIAVLIDQRVTVPCEIRR